MTRRRRAAPDVVDVEVRTFGSATVTRARLTLIPLPPRSLVNYDDPVRVQMMAAIRAAWDSADNALADAIWSRSDGYGVPGLVPPQGYDWSGIRDSTDAAVRAMYGAVLAAQDGDA